MPIINSLGALKNFNVKAFSGTGNLGYYTGKAVYFLNTYSDGTYIYISGWEDPDFLMTWPTIRITNTGAVDTLYNRRVGGSDFYPLTTLIHPGSGKLFIFNDFNKQVPTYFIAMISHYPNPNSSPLLNTTGDSLNDIAFKNVIANNNSGTTPEFYGAYDKKPINNNLALFKSTYTSGVPGSGTFVFSWRKKLSTDVITKVYDSAINSSGNVFFAIGSYLGNLLINSSGSLLYQSKYTATHPTYGVEALTIYKSVFDSSDNVYCLAIGDSTSALYLLKLSSTLTLTWCKQITFLDGDPSPSDNIKLFLDSTGVYIASPKITGSITTVSIVKLDKSLLDGSTYPVLWSNIVTLEPDTYLIDKGIYVIGNRICIVTSKIWEYLVAYGTIPQNILISLPADGRIPYKGAYTITNTDPPYNPITVSVAKTNSQVLTVVGTSIPTSLTLINAPTSNACTQISINSSSNSSITWNNLSFGS